MPYLAVVGLHVLCIVHLMRNGRNAIWLAALIFLPGVGPLAYLRITGEEARCRYAALLLAEGWERRAIKVVEGSRAG